MPRQDGGSNKVLNIFFVCSGLILFASMMAMAHGHGRAGRRRDDQVVRGDRVQGGLHEVILCNLSLVNMYQ